MVLPLNSIDFFLKKFFGSNYVILILNMIFTRITDRKCPIARYLFYEQIDIETHLLISALSWLIFFHRDLTYTFHQMFGHMKIRAVCLVWENDASYI